MLLQKLFDPLRVILGHFLDPNSVQTITELHSSPKYGNVEMIVIYEVTVIHWSLTEWGTKVQYIELKIQSWESEEAVYLPCLYGSYSPALLYTSWADTRAWSGSTVKSMILVLTWYYT